MSNCSCSRIAQIHAKCSDMFSARIGGKEYEGYVPSDLGIGGGDYVKFKYCLDCGKIQEKFPRPSTEIEAEESEDN